MTANELHCILYVSHAATPFDETELDGLARHAAATNAEHGISGYLTYSGGRFLQYFEGRTDDVDALMRNIERDERHAVHRQARASNLAERRFPDWSMRVLRRSDYAHMGLETQLEGWMLSPPPGITQTHWEPRLWDLVDAVARLQGRLRALRG